MHWFDQTGLPWTNPSPNMRSLTAATLYPGVGLLESAGVGRARHRHAVRGRGRARTSMT